MRRMTDETPDYMTDEEPEYTADELGDHDDLLAEGRLGHVEHIGAMWRTGFVRYEPDGHSMTRATRCRRNTAGRHRDHRSGRARHRDS